MALLGASALGTETLKNLVLPGIGSFTILDGTTVTEEDVACNFFLTRKDLGASRAEAATYWLGELNDDVQGNSINKVRMEVGPSSSLPLTLSSLSSPLSPFSRYGERPRRYFHNLPWSF